MIEPIRRLDHVIEILDQRALPEQITYLVCVNADDVIAAIKALAVRGAPAIGIAGLYGLWLEAKLLKQREDFVTYLAQTVQRIKSARPTAVNLAWALDRTYHRVQGIGSDEVVSVLRREADGLFEEERQRNLAMASLGASLFAANSRVLTHCNTGSLATVGVGTALGVIREGFRLGRVAEVYVDETRPLLQGARLTAWELQQDKIPATLITDSMAGSLMARDKVDAVIVGADRIALNGDTANKIGTYGLAVLAHYHHVPFYVVAPMSTVDVALENGTSIPIEQRSADEVRMVRGTLIAPANMPTYNPAFDVTPGALIDAIVTDRGIARVPYRTSLERLIADENVMKMEE